MAIRITREISADVVKRGSTRTVYAKQNDHNSRFLNVRIQEEGQDIVVDATSTVMLNVERPDKSEKIFYGTVNEGGTVRVPLTSWMLELEGNLQCDISIVDEDPTIAKLTTMQFSIYVEAATVCDESIVETEEYSVIVDLLTRTDAATLKAEQAAADAELLRMNCEEATEAANEVVDEATALIEDLEGYKDKVDKAVELQNDVVDVERQLAVESARVDGLLATKGSGDLTVYKYESDEVYLTIKHNGVAAHMSFGWYGTLYAGGWESFPVIPNYLAPITYQRFQAEDGPLITLMPVDPEEAVAPGYARLVVRNNTPESFTDLVEGDFEYDLATISLPEVTDMRIGADGTTYPTAGDAVREQFKNLQESTVRQGEYGIKIKGANSSEVSVEVFNEETETGYKKSSLRFLGYSDDLVRLSGVADGTNDFDAATVGQVKKMLKNAGGSSEEAYLYTSFTVAVADLNASTTENADATDENAVCAIYTNSDGNACLLLLSDIVITANVKITVPVIFDVNSYEISYSGAYSITFSGDNSVLDCRTGVGRVIKDDHTAPMLIVSGENFKLLGGYFRYEAPAESASLAIVNQSAGSLTIDGAEMYMKSTSGGKGAMCVNSKNAVILNSKFICVSVEGAGYGVQSGSSATYLSVNNCSFSVEAVINATGVFLRDSAAEYDMRNNTFNAHAESGDVYGIYAGAGTIGNLADCEILISSVSGSGCALYNNGNAEVENSIFFADGTTGSVSEGNEDYAGTQGILNSGTITLLNCNVCGTHTGIQCSGASITKINGGLFEGPGHGGIYVTCANGGQFYAENCTVKNSPYRGKYKDKFFYGNSQYMVAAVYIGGGNGIKAYFDNCILDGGGPEKIPDYETDGTFKEYIGAEPIRFRMSSDEKNNAAYISNCTLMGDGKIRFANATHSLHLGFYNRILCEPSLESCMVDEGRVVYTGYEEFRIV